MAEENNEGTGEGAGDEGQARHDVHLERTRRDRDGWKAKATDAERRLAERDAKDREAAAKQERDAGEIDKVLARYKRDLDEATDRASKAELALADRDKRDRRGAFANAIATEAKAGNPKTIAALLPGLGLEDDAPEAPGPSDVKRAIKALEREHPELFSKPDPTIKPKPGSGGGEESNSDDAWRKKGAAYSERNGHAAYTSFTGRTNT